MTLTLPDTVDNFLTTTGLSTGRALFAKLFISSMWFPRRFQTVFGSAQVLDIKVENRLVHTNWPCLSTTAIDL
jgi:hypothetical protein